MNRPPGRRVNHATFEPTLPEDVNALPEAEVVEGQMRRAIASNAPVQLTRYNERVDAIGDTCTHRGCSLSGGTLNGDVVTCLCHDSQYSATGGMIQVRSTAPPC
ncbi:MAG: Rieske (2Fe-2S) protein [Chloroflexota bacterium]